MQCLRTVLARLDTWQKRISNDQLLDMWGDKRPLAVRIRQRRLEWLVHVARMPPERIPKILLFGLLPSRRPPGGPRKCWKDCISADLKALNAVEGWYDLADSRPDWHRMYCCCEPEPPTPNVHCQVCDRYFSRPSDEKRLLSNMLLHVQCIRGILCVIQRDAQRDIHSCATLNVGGMRRGHSTCHAKVSLVIYFDPFCVWITLVRSLCFTHPPPISHLSFTLIK